jgi:TolA-binding protein
MSNIKPLHEVLTMTRDEVGQLTHSELAELAFALITEVHFGRDAHSREKKLIEQQLQVMNTTINTQRVEIQKANMQIDTLNKNTQNSIKKLYTKLTWKERLTGRIDVDNTREEGL